MQEPGRMESGPQQQAGRPGEDADEISLLELANVLLKRWKLVAGFPLAVAVLTAMISLVVPATYTAHAVFVPEVDSQGSSLPGGVARLAAQFGVSVGGGTGASPRFYADVLESRSIRDRVLLSRFADPLGVAPGDSAILLDILRIEGDSEAERLERGREFLDGAVLIRFNAETRVVNVAVQSRYPTLSADISNRFIEELSYFNLETRQSAAGERRRFVEERMSQAEDELHAAEEALKRFLERNRVFRGAPELEFEHDRLQRQVAIKQEIFTTLRRSYEEARIEEVNDTPVITVIDPAVPPEQRSSPKRKLMVVLAFVLSGVVGVFIAFGKEFVERAKERDQREYKEVSASWASVKRELKSGFSRLRRPRS